ncbi:AEC family transporter [Hydrocarboniclastica marina]|uniref:AEC family transporter n=1 Tax=Hydrocarboniclastica marina TaxID=2259620 RepID=A0A4P7XJB4_9ALTE|nr:AEC family transporter [Hydrocarboniclastica marina]QCF27209.1 AEC family transporter [Hydrocarboniclastica marina]
MGFIQALLPVFLLILLGHLLRRASFPDANFWAGAERFTYYVLFPAMLVFKLGSADVPHSIYAQTGVLILAMVLVMAALLVMMQWLIRWPGAVFTSVFQGGIRFNSYVGLAAAASLYGEGALSVTAVAVAIMVPILNVICILVFSIYASESQINARAVASSIVSNPLILGSLGGVFISYFSIGFHPLVAGVIQPLSNLALPLGLMTVGAGLQLKALRRASTSFLAASAVKLVLFPLITAGLCMALGIGGTMAQVAVLLASLPTASSAFILARQLGGDAPLMAAIISGQTLLAMLTMPLMLGLLAQ